MLWRKACTMQSHVVMMCRPWSRKARLKQAESVARCIILALSCSENEAERSISLATLTTHQKLCKFATQKNLQKLPLSTMAKDGPSGLNSLTCTSGGRAALSKSIPPSRLVPSHRVHMTPLRTIIRACLGDGSCKPASRFDHGTRLSPNKIDHRLTTLPMRAQRWPLATSLAAPICRGSIDPSRKPSTSIRVRDTVNILAKTERK
ncbi:hypothetical protein BKA66DRAFT_7167 [Pyrenochaeta sp. MPI-SDFR-AT-0127]|nr:hypothetical protein BKA66DRAFT_7167 [Pyrenochaeta sp. MPI-SDFR-AT-0127]